MPSIRYFIATVLALTALQVTAADEARILASTRAAVEKLEAVNLARLPVRYANGKTLEGNRQHALQAAQRIKKEIELLRTRRPLEAKFLLTVDLRNLYDSMQSLWLGLSDLAVEPPSLQDETTAWVTNVSDASGPVHNVLLDLQDELQVDLKAADGRLRKCK